MAIAHVHDHAEASHDRAFAVGVTLNAGFVVVEIISGFLTGSLALLADAGHNLSDVLALTLAWGALALTRRAPTERRTYGFRRSSILAALANSLILLFVIGGVTWEAVRRLFEPATVPGAEIAIIAAIGVVVNGSTALLFLSGRERDANIRGAFLHMASDAAVSLGVVAAGLLILRTGWQWIDPAISIGVSLAILFGTLALLRDSMNLALDAVPARIDPAAVRAYLLALPGVQEVHDLHVWAMSTTETALTAHVVALTDNDDAFLAVMCEELHEQFEIEHATIQLERGDPDYPCVLAEEHAL
jgi:cobalt-zinc-cadmium efflux system protein